MQSIVYETFHDHDTDLFVSFGKSNLCAKHFHRSFEMLYITNGTMTGEVNGKSFTATEDDIVFVSNYYTHSYIGEHECERFCIVVPSNMSADFIGKFKKKTLPHLLADKQFNRKIREILSIDGLKDKPHLIKKGYVLVIFGMLLEHYQQVDVESNLDIYVIVDILNYIDENYTQNITLDSISSAFGYNKYYFSKLFNRYVQESLMSYINIVRIHKLTLEALNSKKPNIATLAFDNGFDSLATFYRYFNKLYGCSPKEYFEGHKSSESPFAGITIIGKK